MLDPGDRVVVGVSGGADSIGLLHSLLELKEYKAELIVAHLNHGIRGREAERDAVFVKRTAESLGLKFALGKADAPGYKKEKKLSPEEAARILRYEFFEKTRRKFGADKIATAHTLDDQAETVLMRLMRGSGAKGLSGIPPVSEGVIIRPLIETARAEIEKYLESKGVGWIEDSTNKLREIQRNRIRLDLIPELETYNPRIRETLARTSDLMRIEEDYIDREAKRYFARIFAPDVRGLKVDLRKFKRLHQALRLGILRLAIEELNKGLRNITSLHLLSADEYLTSGAVSGEVEFPDTIVIAKGYDSFLVTTRSGLERKFSYSIGSPGKWRFPEFEVDIVEVTAETLEEKREDIVYLDSGKLAFPIEVRNFRAGDSFIPLGMKGEKKLKNFFVDEKIPRFERYRIPIFTSRGEIFWVGGMRIDDRFKVRRKGNKALKLSLRMP
ncbi:MAG: tRNA lysidine(34) synthetase TilS [Thermodesulfobacteriota bacterium]